MPKQQGVDRNYSLPYLAFLVFVLATERGRSEFSLRYFRGTTWKFQLSLDLLAPKRLAKQKLLLIFYGSKVMLATYATSEWACFLVVALSHICSTWFTDV
jgi:hypothetical protein